MKTEPREWPQSGWTPRAIYAELDRYVIGQDRAKRVVSIGAYNHVKRLEMRAGGVEIPL